MAAEKWLNVRVTVELADAVHREARALKLSDSAYLRMLIEIGRDRTFLQHAISELLSPEVREALWTVLGISTEVRELQRSQFIGNGKDAELREAQGRIVEGIQRWKGRLRVGEK